MVPKCLTLPASLHLSPLLLCLHRLQTFKRRWRSVRTPCWWTKTLQQPTVRRRCCCFRCRSRRCCCCYCTLLLFVSGADDCCMCPLAGKTIQTIGFISALLGKTGGPEDASFPELPVSLDDYPCRFWGVPSAAFHNNIWKPPTPLSCRSAGQQSAACHQPCGRCIACSGKAARTRLPTPIAVCNAITLICNATAHCWPQCHCPAAQRLERMEAPLEDSYELLDEEW